MGQGGRGDRGTGWGGGDGGRALNILDDWFLNVEPLNLDWWANLLEIG